jgi:hypothetical protein
VECHQTADRRYPIEDLIGQDLQIVTFGQVGAEHAIFDGFLLEGELECEIFGNYIANLKGVTRLGFGSGGALSPGVRGGCPGRGEARDRGVAPAVPRRCPGS